MLSHKTYFDKLIKDIESVDPQSVVALVSEEGFVLSSNTPDESADAQLAAMVSVFMDYGKKIFAIPGVTSDQTNEAVRTNVSVGDRRYVLVTQLAPHTFIIVAAEDKNRISTMMRKTLEYVDATASMMQKKEIVF